jgi:hypothetical protein
MTGHKWLRRSLARISREMSQIGPKISPATVGRLLKSLKYSLKVNRKHYEGQANHPQRDQQFKQIEQKRVALWKAGLPVISVDTKKKELIGNFRNNGQTYKRQPEKVKAHDFPSEAEGQAVPYGIYDLRYGRGSVYVGESADTPEFAVAAIVRWWQEEGWLAYWGARQLLILAGRFGSNSCRARLWKEQLQSQLCDRYGLTVVVAHYPTGCSKWNVVEHKLFAPISLNWAGEPLRSFEIMLGYISGTSLSNGRPVRAERLRGQFEKGKKVSQAEMERLNLESAEICSQWNYILRPRGQFNKQETAYLKTVS